MRFVKEDKKKRVRVRIPEDVQVPGTNVILEAGDVIEIIEAKKSKKEDDDEPDEDDMEEQEDDDEPDEDDMEEKGKKGKKK